MALLDEAAFDTITVQDIVKRAGVGYATFFRHFTDKEALLQSLAAQEVRALMALTLPVLIAVDARASALALCDHVDMRRRLWTALLTGGAAGRLREEFIRQANALTPAETPSDAWPPRDLLVPFAIGGVLDILSWWLRQDTAIERSRVAALLADLVISPLVAGNRARMDHLRDQLAAATGADHPEATV